MKDLLGGKGANLCEMSRIGLPVPPGFVFTTETCIDYFKDNKTPKEADNQMIDALKKIEEQTDKEFGSSKKPLLISVRSGARVSMPGMMDTILNVGLNDEVVKGIAALTQNERFAYDAYRRLIQMFGNVVKNIPIEKFEEQLEKIKKDKGAKNDVDLGAEDLRNLIEKYKQVYKKETGKNFPQDPLTQLRSARDAVFSSWNNKRAKVYRKFHNIPEDWGTAAVVQAMVFGNLGPTSGTGVGFTRDPATGEKKIYGEYLLNAQGEDVVAGIRTPKPLSQLKTDLPDIFEELLRVQEKLEKHYKDMQDFEFTIENGKLYMLQTRTAKRTAQAAVKIAVDMVEERVIDKRTAVMRVDPHSLDQLLHPHLDLSSGEQPIAHGLPASPGAASGKIVFTSGEAKEAADRGESVILIRPETTPEDIHGIVSAKGVLTSRGGMTSHAAVVARGMGKPCIVGCEQIKIGPDKFAVGDKEWKKGDVITLDGANGNVYSGALPTLPPSLSNEFKQLLKWADEIRYLGVMANADNKKDASKARELGAEGIGLCRTEHMFLEKTRLPVVQEMILAQNTDERKKALEKLLEVQQKDFYDIFEAMDGLPVTIRLLDPPLHEFLPSLEKLLVEVTKEEEQGKVSPEKKKLLKIVRDLSEKNPMLGFRGCRLAIVYPEIYEMQTRAIYEAAIKAKNNGIVVKPEIMIPLVSVAKELGILRALVRKTAKEVLDKHKERMQIKIGTMIELPRAALTADEIANYADFFSFGTNDLTQTTFGFSRDDAEGKFLPNYLDKKVIDADPFVSIDEAGVGKLIKMTVELGRRTKPQLKIGICGEQGGDPKSVDFCNRSGLNYVSCSPFRVPIARLSAAQATIKNKNLN